MASSDELGHRSQDQPTPGRHPTKSHRSHRAGTKDVLPNRCDVVQGGRERMLGWHPIVDRQHRHLGAGSDQHGFGKPGLAGVQNVRAAVDVDEQVILVTAVDLRWRHPIGADTINVLLFDSERASGDAAIPASFPYSASMISGRSGPVSYPGPI